MLARSPGPTVALLEQMEPKTIWSADYDALRACGLNERPARSLLDLRAACPVADLRRDVGRSGQMAVCRNSSPYPDDLLHLNAPPAVLFIDGSGERWERVVRSPRFTVVGTRNASHYGVEAARMFARRFAERGVVVVSGLARGIDAAAHAGALEAGGLSVAVVGGGADVAYPATHRDLYARLAATGAVVSEMPPGTRPRKWSFPLRNRLLAALGHALLVIEVGHTSGGLITCREAATLGRTVYVVPGPVVGGGFAGSHRLIADGAVLAADPDEVLEDFAHSARMQHMNWALDPGRVKTASGPRDTPGGDLDRLVEASLGARVLSVGDVALVVGCGPREATRALSRLELAGRVVRRGPGRYAVRG